MIDKPERDVAVMIRRQRMNIARNFENALVSWPKFFAEYRDDPASFMRRECLALVDYILLWLETGDTCYRDLYIGEKAKQFYDPDVPIDEQRRRQRTMLDGELQALLAATTTAAAAATIKTMFDRIAGPLLDPATAEVRVLFIGDCLYLDVIAFLTAPLMIDGVRLKPSFITVRDPYQQRSALARAAGERFDLVFYSPLAYGFDPSHANLARLGWLFNAKARTQATAIARDHCKSMIDTIADLFDCPIFVHAPVALARHKGRLRTWLRLLLTGGIRRNACARLCETIRATVRRRADNGARVHAIEESELVDPIGLYEAGRFFYHSALQHPARFGQLVAAHYLDIIVATANLLWRKVLVCDLDNTLWSGMTRKAGGASLRDDRQQTVLDLKRRGVVLAINAGNDPARLSWEGRGAVLSRADFASAQINADPKPLNMGRISEHLNLSTADFAFVEDRADERASVKGPYPAIMALDACDPRVWRLLRWWADLLPDRPAADRTAFYRQRDARQAFLTTEPDDTGARRMALYDTLALQLEVREAGPQHLARVADLINRTNQFNLTGRRITARKVADYARSPDTRVLIAEAADRFGDMGAISVLIAVRDGNKVRIPFFVLSCRVFGYDMELAMLEEARKLSCVIGPLWGDVRETALNGPCRNVYERAGFLEGPLGWCHDPIGMTVIAVPPWLTVQSNVTPFAPTALTDSPTLAAGRAGR